MKKKVLALILSVTMCFAITACGDKETGANAETTESTEPTIVAEETIVAPEDDLIPADEEPGAEESTEESEEADTQEASEETPEDGEEASGDAEIKVEIPDEFSEVSEGMYMAEDGANIIVATTPGSSEIPTQDALEAQLVATVGEDSEIKIVEYEQYKVGDYDALRFTAQYKQDEIEVVQTQCMVFGDGQIGLAAFTQQADGTWGDVFDACIAGITME